MNAILFQHQLSLYFWVLKLCVSTWCFKLVEVKNLDFYVNSISNFLN